MQKLEFVNVSGPEPWKNKEAKKFVRSHAMKDFRRKQRERTTKGRVKKSNQPGETSFTVANKKVKICDNSPESAVIPLRATSSDCTPGQLVAQSKGLHIDLSSPLYALPDQNPFNRRASSPISVNGRLYSGLPSPSPSDSSDSSSNRPMKLLRGSPDRQLHSDFDLGVSTAVFSVLDEVQAQFERMTTKFFHSVHSYLAFIHQPRFQNRVAASKLKADAELGVLLLSMKLVAEPVNYTLSDRDPRYDPVYIAAKHLHKLVASSKGPSLDLVQSGILICLYEHNSAIENTAYKTLVECANMAQSLGLNVSRTQLESGTSHTAAYQEESRRTHWALVSLDGIITLHDEKRERSMVMPTPFLDDIIPSVKENYWDDPAANEEYLSPAYTQTVSSQLPKWAHSFCRQAQSARLMAMVQRLLRNRFEDNPATMRVNILTLDQLLQENMAKSLFDCNGNCTQHCGPISMSISASYLLHEYQLLATMTSSDPADIEALSRSKLAIVKLIQMMVDILRMFPISHLPELSPSALYCPYMAGKLSLQLDRVNGVNAPPTLAPDDFELIVESLRKFSTLWKSTDYYLKDIERARSRALPMPLLSIA